MPPRTRHISIPAPNIVGAFAALTLLSTGARNALGQQGVAVLDTVRVSVGSRSAGSGVRSEEVITREEIARTPARTIADVLDDALGVEIVGRSPAQSDITMRGSSTTQVLILVDGVRVNDQQTEHANLDLAVPLEDVERIEILRGAGSTLYGPDAAGGVVNIITTGHDGAAASRRSLRGWGGSFGTGGASGAIADSIGAFGVQASVEHERSDGHRADTDYGVTLASVAAARRVGSGRLRARAGLGVRSFGAADFYATYPSHERTRSATGSISYDFSPTDRVRTSLTASTRHHSDDYVLVRDDPSLYHNRHRSSQSGIEAVARIALAPTVVAAIGAEGSDARLRSERLGDRDEQRGALFAEATVGNAGSARIDAGARIDWSSVNHEFVSPSIGGVLPIGSWTRLRASVSRGFRAPTWTERYYEDPANVGDPDLRPEKFWGGEAGVSLAPGKRWSADITGFYRHASDLIDWARRADADSTAPWRTTNVARADYRGAELALRLHDWLGASWALRGSALDFDSHGVEGLIGKYALRPVTRSAGLKVTAPLGRGPAATLDAAYDDRSGEDGHFRLDARLAQRWRDMRIVLDIRNITDADYLDASVKPVAGRSAFITLEWSGGR
jgi:iron complex outermembrane receptor protein